MSVRVVRVILLAAAAFLASRHDAEAQLQIKAGDDVNISFGILGQIQADSVSNNPESTNTNNLFFRRIRLIAGGQVVKHVTFFLDTDAPNLGKTSSSGKSLTTPMILQDAYAEFKASDAFALDAGLMYVPFSRNALQAAPSLLPIDFGANTFATSAPTQSSAGRDTGFQARGYLLYNHLEYRAGIFQGARNADSTNGFRYAARVQFDVFDPETDFFYAGTYLGAKRVLAFGGAIDAQDTYRAYAADAFLDWPVGPGAFTGQFDYNRLNGNTTFTTLPRQNDYLVEAGYLIRKAKVTPVLQLSNRDLLGVSMGDELRWSLGLNYWWAGHNANVKGAYTRIHPTDAPNQNEFTVQLQFFYFRAR